MMYFGGGNNYGWLIAVIVVIVIILIIFMMGGGSKAGKGKKGEGYYNPSTFAALPPAYAGSLRGTM